MTKSSTEIYGYSERGMMNALFYWNNDVKSLQKLLEISGVENFNSYNNFKIIMEGSLSDFGDSDAILIADNNNEKTVFFFEAKVSNGNSYKLQQQFDKFKSKESYNGYSSNLFYQLSLKKLLFNKIRDIKLVFSEYITTKGKNRENERTVNTKNETVNFIYEMIRECSHAEFVAITPDIPTKTFLDNIRKHEDLGQFSSKIHFITWERIINEYDNLTNTLDFNCKNGKNLIFNKQTNHLS